MASHRTGVALLLVTLAGLLTACTAQVSSPGPPATVTVTTISPAPSVLATGDNVYAGSNDGSLYSFKGSDGSLRWRFKTGGVVAGKPTLASGIVYVGSEDHFVYAVRADSGTQVWKQQLDGPCATTSLAQGTLYTGTTAGTVYALRAADGAIVWRAAAEHVYDSLAVADGVVYVGGQESGHDVFAFRASDGALLWKVTTGDDNKMPVEANGLLYVSVFSSGIVALRPADGTQVWRFDMGAHSPPTVVGSVVYVQSFEGTLYALRAQDGTQIWSQPYTDFTIASPAVANGFVYADSLGTHLFAFNARDGTVLWHRDDLGPVATPTVVDGAVFVGTGPASIGRPTDSSEFALRASDGATIWQAKAGDAIYSQATVGP
jgi:outer membrane protein assembly factor BamB